MSKDEEFPTTVYYFGESLVKLNEKIKLEKKIKDDEDKLLIELNKKLGVTGSVAQIKTLVEMIKSE